MLSCTVFKMQKSAVIILLIAFQLVASLITPNNMDTCVGNDSKLNWMYITSATPRDILYEVKVPGGSFVPILYYNGSSASVYNNYNIRWDYEKGAVTIVNSKLNNTGNYSMEVSYLGGEPTEKNFTYLLVLEKVLGCSCAAGCVDTNSTCSDNKTCKCSSEHYDDNGESVLGGNCAPKKLLGDPCVNDIMCADPHSFCGSTCNCRSGYYDSNGGFPGGTCKIQPQTTTISITSPTTILTNSITSTTTRKTSSTTETNSSESTTWISGNTTSDIRIVGVIIGGSVGGYVVVISSTGCILYLLGR